jgi:hypothetical protein
MSKPTKDTAPQTSQPWPREQDERSTSKAAHGDALAKAVGGASKPVGERPAKTARGAGPAGQQPEEPEDDNMGI